MQRPATKRKDAKPSRRPRPGAAQPRRDDARHDSHAEWTKKAARLERETSWGAAPRGDLIEEALQFLRPLVDVVRRAPYPKGGTRLTLIRVLLDLGVLTKLDLEVHEAAENMEIYLLADEGDDYLRAQLAFNPFLRRTAELYRPDIIEKYGPTPATVAATTKRYLAGGPAVKPVQPTMRRKTSKRRAA